MTTAHEDPALDPLTTHRNAWGDIDVRDGTPPGLKHIEGQRLQPLCRKLEIDFARALVGFDNTYRDYYSPRFCGVVVGDQDAPRLEATIAARSATGSIPSEEEFKARARRVHKSRVTKAGGRYEKPTSTDIEEHDGDRYVVLRVGARILSEFVISGSSISFVDGGPATRGARLATLETLPDDALLDLALASLHALNRRVKHAQYSYLRRDVYAAKDVFLDAMVVARRATVGTFVVSSESVEKTCSQCGRSWYGNSWCYRCAEDSGEGSPEEKAWYLIDCGSGYRFHQPRVAPEVAAAAVQIEPHEPTQPPREIPVVEMPSTISQGCEGALDVAAQLASVRLATQRLLASRANTAGSAQSDHVEEVHSS